MILLISILLSVFVISVVVGTLMWVKTPHYQVDRAQAIQLLEWMILGQASENDWRVFCDYPIRHNDQLELVRQRCLEIEEDHYIGDTRAGHLLDREGLEQLRELLDQLHQGGGDQD